MILCVSGSRTITDYKTVAGGIEQGLGQMGRKPQDVTQLISGNARGVDRLAEAWARFYGIPIAHFIPEWDRYGKSAGMRRNKQMADASDLVICLWDGESRGTKQMYDYCRGSNGLIPVILLNMDGEDD